MNNFKIRCIWVSTLDSRGFSVNGIYEVIDGYLILPNNDKSSCTYNCVEDINANFYAKFEVVE